MRMASGVWRFIGVVLALLLAMKAATAQPPLTPVRFADFDHYTLALSWHPGFCQTEGRGRSECGATRPGARLVLHGLWPSLPDQLQHQGVTQSEWWQTGCYHFSGEPQGGFCRLTPLVLDDTLHKQLDQAMPGTASCLERHEYTKHAACFGVSAQTYFDTALRLYRQFNDSDWSDFVRLRAGTMVARETLLERFRATFHVENSRALRLTCERRDNVAWLTGIAVGIHRQALEDFPQPHSLAPLEPGNCPGRLLITDAPRQERK